ncbi:unnamed protein product [Owenia fusiformis]|uniref:Uncharacterized protein n=1 Tax=Owenia fusiformis TaxID=6347 RepID=A0A8J1US85_OWEFU|nr:unnamed protein product [Owenia fusiformis]
MTLVETSDKHVCLDAERTNTSTPERNLDILNIKPMDAGLMKEKPENCKVNKLFVDDIVVTSSNNDSVVECENIRSDPVLKFSNDEGIEVDTQLISEDKTNKKPIENDWGKCKDDIIDIKNKPGENIVDQQNNDSDIGIKFESGRHKKTITDVNNIKQSAETDERMEDDADSDDMSEHEFDNMIKEQNNFHKANSSTAISEDNNDVNAWFLEKSDDNSFNANIWKLDSENNTNKDQKTLTIDEYADMLLTDPDLDKADIVVIRQKHENNDTLTSQTVTVNEQIEKTDSTDIVDRLLNTNHITEEDLNCLVGSISMTSQAQTDATLTDAIDDLESLLTEE